MEDIKPIEQPFHIVAVLDKKEGFHSGYATKELAEANLKIINAQASELSLRTKYSVKAKV